MDEQRVDVIINTMNSASTLRQCLESVVREIPLNKIIVVDGGSTDESVDIAKEFDCDVYVRPDLNLGRSRLFAFRKATTSWFCQIDSDEALHEGWWKEVSEYTNRPEVGAVEVGRVNYYKIPFPPNKRRAMFGQNLIRRSIVDQVSDMDVKVNEDELFRRFVEIRGYRWLQIDKCLADHYGPYYSFPYRYRSDFKLEVMSEPPKWAYEQLGILDALTGRSEIIRLLLYPFYKAALTLLKDLKNWTLYCKGLRSIRRRGPNLSKE
jgi:glycosyltransferase involved in cell wall biosynthesis